MHSTLQKLKPYFSEVKFIENLNELKLTTLESEVVFLYAEWGLIQTPIENLILSAQKMNVKNIPVIILNIDEVPREELLRIFGFKPQGKGEFIFMQGGHQVKTIPGGLSTILKQVENGFKIITPQK